MADGTLMECLATEQFFQVVWLTAAGLARLGKKVIAKRVLYGLASAKQLWAALLAAQNKAWTWVCNGTR